MSETLQSDAPMIEPGTVCAAVFVLAVGTGGIATEQMLHINGTNFLAILGRPLAHANPQANASASSIMLTERITVIRSNFDLTTANLAVIFRVARQTVYDWMAERKIPQSSSLARIHDLYALSVAWRSEIGPNIETLHRKFADKDELLELLSAETLNANVTRKALCRIAQARAAVAPQSKSMTELMQEHGFHSASKQRQDEAIAHAGHQ